MKSLYLKVYVQTVMDLELFIEMLGIPSTSGEERRFADFLKERLAAPEVIEKEVGDGTLNLLLDWSGTGHPSFVFCTHLDTVPPYVPPFVELVKEGDRLPDGAIARTDDTMIKGRGSCDAKGQLFTMYNACLRLQQEGFKDFGLLLLSGEETGSQGAKAYNRDCPGGDFVLVGEPTDNCLATAAKGTKSFEVTITGKACHSGYPENGVSAVERFVDTMENLRGTRFRKDPILGPTTWNVGDLISGNPQNILSPEVRFRIYFRTTFLTDPSIQEVLLSVCPPGATVQAFGGDTPQEYFHEVKGIKSKPVSFGSDAPRLEKFTRKAICGPGSILTAHTDKEYILVSDMKKAVEQDILIYKTVNKIQ
ncbi:MAG: M20/M25/M40 family metallo-hydrolase [Bacteroidales bacterium]|nr:M20/M25/M40 family metallo-hydrolase [Bacteroidales bacterium]